MNTFEDQVKDTLKSETPDVLQSIKQSHRFQVPEQPKKKTIFSTFQFRKARFTFASLFLVALLAIVLLNQPAEQIYASTVTIDLNPQIQITVDEDDNVIDIIALNNDGEEIMSGLRNYKREQLNIVLEKVVNQLYQNGYLNNEGNTVMVYVEGVNAQVQSRIQAAVENKLQQEANKYQATLQFIRRNNLDYSEEELQRIKEFAQEYNVHPGRVILILEIMEADDSYRISDLRTLTMRELNDLYRELTNPDGNQGNNNGQGNGN